MWLSCDCIAREGCGCHVIVLLVRVWLSCDLLPPHRWTRLGTAGIMLGRG